MFVRDFWCCVRPVCLCFSVIRFDADHLDFFSVSSVIIDFVQLSDGMSVLFLTY